MKYTRLSKEQFEELNKEFAQFLASQSISATEWSEIKKSKPEMVEEELDLFSDMIWDGVLNKVDHIEHFSKKQIHLFYFDDADIKLIAIKVNSSEIDLTSTEGYNWLRENLMNDEVVFFNSSKDYSLERNLEIFDLIQKGGAITKGELFTFFKNIIN